MRAKQISINMRDISRSDSSDLLRRCRTRLLRPSDSLDGRSSCERAATRSRSAKTVPSIGHHSTGWSLLDELYSRGFGHSVSGLSFGLSFRRDEIGTIFHGKLRAFYPTGWQRSRAVGNVSRKRLRLRTLVREIVHSPTVRFLLSSRCPRCPVKGRTVLGGYAKRVTYEYHDPCDPHRTAAIFRGMHAQKTRRSGNKRYWIGLRVKNVYAAVTVYRFRSAVKRTNDGDWFFRMNIILSWKHRRDALTRRTVTLRAYSFEKFDFFFHTRRPSDAQRGSR